MANNLALAMGALLAGAVVVDYGAKAFKGATTSASNDSSDGSSSTPSTADSTVSSSAGPVANTSVPDAAWNPLSKPIANWIVPILQWASENGWTGTVTSGYRDYADQAAINASGAYSATAGTSNHETAVYPGGAVDVTDPSELIAVLKNYPGVQKLVGGILGAIDPEHFSATGH